MSDPRDHYAQIERHRKAGNIIRKYSSNKENIYDQAIRKLDMSRSITVLDIGCGYGNFTEAFARYADKKAVCHGLDCRINFNETFQRILQTSQLNGHFYDGTADYITQVEANTYDVVLSAYSLYYFPELLHQINRILKSTGVLLAITHSKEGMHEFYDDLRVVKQQMGLDSNEYFELECQVETFCSENAIDLLSPHFNEIRVVMYNNMLTFHAADLDQLIYYLEFRMDMMSEDSRLITPKNHSEFKQHFFKYVAAQIEQTGSYTLTKTDAIMYATHPKKEHHAPGT